MDWAHYRKTGNAIKIHLALELNRMLPVQLISTDANASEKTALLAMLESGVTYIADRGYLGFSLFHETEPGIERRCCTFVVPAVGSTTRLLERSGKAPIIAVV